MADNILYLSAVKNLTERNLSPIELIQAGESLKAAGAFDLSLDLYKRWIALNQGNSLLHAVYFNYSVLLTARGDLAGAKDALERALALKPDFFPASVNLGGVLEKLGVADKAIANWTAVVNQLGAITGLNIGYKLAALKQIGRVLEAHHQNANAEMVLRQSLDIDPTQREIVEHFVALRLQQCEWPVVSGSGVAREALMRKMGPLPMSIYTDDPLLQLATAWSYNKETIGYPVPCPDLKPRPANSGRLRVGYLSSDLRSHAIGSLMPEVFELHDRRKIEVFAYYCGIPAEDPIKARLRAAIEHWVDIASMDDVSAARRIAADGIDILVDVNGYTREARTKLLAMRPAPIIVNWLGYPGTMGSPYHHYIIADEWIIPKEHEIYFSEKVLRLPCYQPNDRKRVVATRRPTRAEAKLPEGAMVYCCFNGTQKVSRFTFDRWMTILQRVPGSVLWLLDGGEAISKRLTEYAAQRGIASDRLVFAPKMAHPDHLARYILADLFLDTAPYGAHTTASDALWMGVPILTLSGRSFASRVCGSLARAAGVPDLVCTNPDQYVERAVALAQNGTDLQQYRKRLAATRDSCVLFDMDSHVRHLEGLYREIWEEFHKGRLPRPDLANLDTYLEVGIEQDHDSVEMLAIKDYRGWYGAKLADRHRRCAIPEDRRLWTAADIARADGAESPSDRLPDTSRHVEPKTASSRSKSRPGAPKGRLKRGSGK
jgi:predicted O-linked N-acetylglucosamine transferase (SPINDLY family)